MAQNGADRVRYQHRQLPRTDSIRVLHLLPRAFNDDIRGTLEEVSLSESPSYEPLSYAWGSPTPTDPISCHGKEVLVTTNCIAAMRRLRYKNRHRVLWIDAICIEQRSMNERNHQVRLMGDIYSKAKRVTIWLGEGTTESDFLMSFMKDYYRIWKYLPALRSILLSNQIKKFNKFEDSSSYSVNGASIGPTKMDNTGVCIKPYPEAKLLVFQSKYVFPSTFRSLHRYFNEVRQAIQLGDRVDEFSLMQILELGRHQIATEPKDAVFAFYGMLQRVNPEIISPGYSKSVQQIYTEVKKMVIQVDKSLQILETTGEDSIWTN